MKIIFFRGVGGIGNGGGLMGDLRGGGGMMWMESRDLDDF